MQRSAADGDAAGVVFPGTYELTPETERLDALLEGGARLRRRSAHRTLRAADGFGAGDAVQRGGRSAQRVLTE